MKHVFSIITVTLLGIMLLSSCKKSDAASNSDGNFTATATFNIDGGNFHEQAISIYGAIKTTTQCNYLSNEKITTVTINDQPDISTAIKNQFFIVFNGNTPSTQHAGDDPNGGTFNSVYFKVSVTDKEGLLHDYLFEDADNTPGVFTISKYGKTGEAVEGTFSGILVDEDGASVIKIKDGNFSITRGRDIE